MEQSYNLIQNLEKNISEIPPDSIISRTVYQDNHLKVILFGFAPGQELSEHTASKKAIIHILSGKASLLLGSDNYEAGEGTWTQMDPLLPHSIKASTRLTMLLYLINNSNDLS